VEHELSWIPHFLNRIDYTYTQRVQEERYRFKEAMLPSDYFHRNVFAGFQEDAMGIRDRHIIGVDNLQPALARRAHNGKRSRLFRDFSLGSASVALSCGGELRKAG